MNEEKFARRMDIVIKNKKILARIKQDICAASYPATQAEFSSADEIIYPTPKR